jgi:putative endonuclease
MVEHAAVNRRVASSSLARGAKSPENRDFVIYIRSFKMYFVYILKSISTGETYIGQTSDIGKRLIQHNSEKYRGTLHTKRRKGPWELIHKEEYETRSEAMRREKELKTGKGRDWIKNNILERCGC